MINAFIINMIMVIGSEGGSNHLKDLKAGKPNKGKKSVLV